MLSTTLNPQTATINATIAASVVPGITFELLEVEFQDSCGRIYDITSQIPLWIRQEKAEKISNNIDGTTIYDLVQAYYDWLYCDSTSGAQYKLSEKFTDNIDIDNCDSDSIGNPEA